MFFGGNWKLNGDFQSLTDLAKAMKARVHPSKDARVVVFAPFVYLPAIHQILKDSPIKLGAQNVSDQNEGAFTGEVSANMLKDVGCDYVLIGHSERRQLYHEDFSMIARKVSLAFKAGLTPVLCVGETLEERKAEKADHVVLVQLETATADISDAELAKLVIAYEPVWAIGTGEVATPDQAQAMHDVIREFLSTRLGENAQAVDIIYGGSMKPDNAAELLAKPDVNGGLIGGASLKADEFAAICSAV
ncbi:MAG: triose-phosphate isomerase [Gammaproteobacteria bacterium CG11_big_fil_rev_8_21_14_0_20_46_22]|nr:MAG: triose-phosphate isomerase [Gammaproteobacteria bacterium CG12_big_fil_rev_8_21_14_0_65_46_12]PIR11411.1 MAG: triose-phosphate isomerase [Gammaproteobacteria bacterium CG11_big_fil_rev_8_21_14_0_20_46_22]